MRCPLPGVHSKALDERDASGSDVSPGVVGREQKLFKAYALSSFGYISTVYMFLHVSPATYHATAAAVVADPAD